MAAYGLLDFWPCIRKQTPFLRSPIGNGNRDHATSSKRLDGAWSALFSNLSKSALDNYVVKRSELGEGCVIPITVPYRGS